MCLIAQCQYFLVSMLIVPLTIRLHPPLHQNICGKCLFALDGWQRCLKVRRIVG
jgi:hypothetical protein